MIHRFSVLEEKENVLGYKYNVQLWTSDDNGQNWKYSGVGRFCFTMSEVLNYIKNC